MQHPPPETRGCISGNFLLLGDSSGVPNVASPDVPDVNTGTRRGERSPATMPAGKEAALFSFIAQQRNIISITAELIRMAAAARRFIFVRLKGAFNRSYMQDSFYYAGGLSCHMGGAKISLLSVTEVLREPAGDGGPGLGLGPGDAEAHD